MSLDLLLILASIFLGFTFLYLALSKKLSEPKTDHTLTEWLKSLQSSLNSNNQNLTSTLQKSYRDLHDRLDNAATIIGDLKKEAGAFGEVGRSMRDLQDYLKSPKLRGNIGEQVLKDLVTQMFPKNSFYLQHPFKSGAIVDTAIQTDAGLIPIDSKFPLENFQKMMKADDQDRDQYANLFFRDVRKHLKDISTKYILTDEGTVDFALMYLPSESIYYEVVNDPDLMEYARSLRVYPVSPTTLYAHLQTVLLSFEGRKIESKTKEIYSLFRSLKLDYDKLDESLGKLNRHLTNAYNQVADTGRIANTIGQKLQSGTNLKSIDD